MCERCEKGKCENWRERFDSEGGKGEVGESKVFRVWPGVWRGDVGVVFVFKEEKARETI